MCFNQLGYGDERRLIGAFNKLDDKRRHCWHQNAIIFFLAVELVWDLSIAVFRG